MDADSNKLAVCGETITSLINLNKAQEEQIAKLQAELRWKDMEIWILQRHVETYRNSRANWMNDYMSQVKLNDQTKASLDSANAEIAQLKHRLDNADYNTKAQIDRLKAEHAAERERFGSIFYC